MSGRVRMRVQTAAPERLIARCLREGADFQHIRKTGPRECIIEADPESAAILIRLCGRFSIPCKVISEHGQSAMLRRLKRRGTLLAALLACVACMTLLLGRVWMIDVEFTDGSTAGRAALESALHALDVRPGMPVHDLDAALLEEELAAVSPDCSFIGVRLQGVRLLVEAAPASAEPELYRLADGGDLVADRDGVILSVNVLAGEACVQPGDTVIRGQVLIRGTERISAEESREIAALGTVIARTWHEGSASCTPTFQKAVRTGSSSVRTELRLMDFSWPLLKGMNYTQQECETEILPIGGLFLPLEILRTTCFETELHTETIDEKALRRALERFAFAAAAKELNRSHPEGCEIADRWIEYKDNPGALPTARAVYEIHANIAVPRDALAQQGG